jgi:diacylglycerol kinase family enzyme
MGSFLFVNPSSGSYARKRVARTLAFLQLFGMTPTLYTVRTPEEVRVCCSAMYAIDDQPFVIVAAGDGTINAVINNLLPGTATLAVLPLGTSNVLAAELGIHSLGDGLKRIAAGNSKPLFLGRLNMEQTSLRFVLMAGIGLDGAVVRDVRDAEKRILKQGAYLLSALKNCLAWESTTLEVITDKDALTCHTAVVCNASRYGGNFVLAPETGIFSPGFVVTCLPGDQRLSYLGAALDLVRGNGCSSSRMQRILCHQVTISGCKPIQIDGDFVGYGPAELVTEPDVCRIIV